jgi:urea-proton symporter
MDISTMFPVYGSMTGWLMIALYAVFIFAITSWYSKGYNKDKEGFLVANRSVGMWQGSMGAGAAWIQAPGLFVAAQQAYQNGIIGLFYFSLGNFFTLWLFAFGVNYFRNKYPDGFTLSQWMGNSLGKAVQWVILFQITIGMMQSMTFSLFAGSHSVQFLTGLNPFYVCIFLTAIALIYTLRGGIKATFITDQVKIAIIWVGMAIIGITVIGHTGVQPIIDGLGGVSGQGTSFFGSSFAWGVFFGFGIPTVTGHFLGPWTDHAFYENALSQKQGTIIKAFILAPIYWLPLPIVGGALGFIAAGLHYNVTGPNTQFINLIVMAREVGPWLALMYLVVVFSGLVSLVDTILMTSATISSNDFHDTAKANSPMNWARTGMILLAIVGIAMANIPGLDIGSFFLFGKAIGLILAGNYVIAIAARNFITTKGFFAGAAVGAFIGSPIYLYGLFFGGGPVLMAVGTGIQVLGGAAMTCLVSYLTQPKKEMAVA